MQKLQLKGNLIRNFDLIYIFQAWEEVKFVTSYSSFTLFQLMYVSFVFREKFSTTLRLSIIASKLDFWVVDYILDSGVSKVTTIFLLSFKNIRLR